MDPLSGGSIDKEQYTPPVKPKEEEKDAQAVEDQNPVVEDKAQTQKLADSKKTLEENRPGKASAETSQETKPKKSGSMFSLGGWTTGILSPEKSSGFRDVAKGLLTDGISNQTIEAKNEKLDQAIQESQLRERLRPVIENDPTLTDKEKKQSLASIPRLIGSLPLEGKKDEENIRQTMRDIFSLEAIPKKDRPGHFLEIAKSAFDSSSFSPEQKTEALKDLVKSASPHMSESELDSFTEIAKILPNESPKEKEIFRDTINKLSDLSENSELSNLERTTKTVGEILDGFSQYRDNAVNDSSALKIQNEQKQAIESLIGSSLSTTEIPDNERALVSRLASDLVINLDDNPATRENEIQELLDFATNATDLNLESVQELKEFGVDLTDKISEAYSHLGRDGQVDLATRITNDVLQNLDISKEYGFNQIAPDTVREGVEQIFDAVDSRPKILEDQKAQVDVLKGVNHIVSSLDSKNKEKLITDAVKFAFSSDGNYSHTEKLLTDIGSKSLSGLKEGQINDLIEFGSAYVNSDQSLSVNDVLGSSDMLGAKIGLDSNKAAAAQRLIADIGVQAFQDIASRTGSPVNVASLKAMLSPGPNGIVGNDGVLDSRDSARVAHQVANNIVNNPVSPEEKSANTQANSQRESQHQAEVKRQAHGQIRQTANQKEAQARAKLPFGGRVRFVDRIINKKRGQQEGAAHGSAQRWYPGKAGNDEVTRGMNKGYSDSRGQAQAQMRQGVVNEAYGQISKSLNDPSSQKSLNMLSQLLNKSSTPNYTKGTMRVDELKSLESLQSIQGQLDLASVSMPDTSRLFAGGEDLDVNKLLGVQPDVEPLKTVKNKEHGQFDVFKDKNTNEEFYRLINGDNETKYAIKKDDGAYAYLDGDAMSYNGKSYQSVVEDFESKKPFELEQGSKGLAGPNNDSFDMFSDRSTGQEFYRRIDESGNALFAVKSQDSKTGWKKLAPDLSLRGRDYSGLVKEFESQNPGSQVAKSLNRGDNKQARSEPNPVQTFASRIQGDLNVTKTADGSNGSKFTYFKDEHGKSFYTIKEKDGNVKLRIGDERAGIPIASDYKHNGVDYSWMIDQIY